MKEGEEYAIETFPTTGTGILQDRLKECSHYMVNYNSNYQKHLKSPFLGDIVKEFNTLAFCKRWLTSKIQIKNLINYVKKVW
jgi:methionine aminopeptidase